MLRSLNKPTEFRARKINGTFGIGTDDLVRSRRSLALSVLGVEADMISARDCGGSPAIRAEFWSSKEKMTEQPL